MGAGKIGQNRSVVRSADSVGGRWIIAANRGPVEFTIGPDGERIQQRGSGGLVTALSALSPHLSDSVWICAPRTEEDRAVALEAPEGFLTEGGGSYDTAKQRVKVLALDPDSFDQYYSVISNPIIWFVQHNLWDLSNAPNITVAERAAFEHGYRAVNAAFADAIVEAMDDHAGPSTVMIHDYHLYLWAAWCAGLVLTRHSRTSSTYHGLSPTHGECYLGGCARSSCWAWWATTLSPSRPSATPGTSFSLAKSFSNYRWTTPTARCG